VVKLDMIKPYIRVEWPFLRHDEEIWFSGLCVSSVRFLVKVNGDLFLHFFTYTWHPSRRSSFSILPLDVCRRVDNSFKQLNGEFCGSWYQSVP
jgi:hypothetical protein